MTVDTRLYDQYIFNFIKQPGTPKRLFWQVVGERAKQLLGDIDKKTKLT